MEGVPELKKMKAGSLRPELYGEISEFLSSVKPDFAISGRTSLYAIYVCLLGARRRKLAAGQLRKAEEMIKAICAAADAPRELRAKELAGPEKGGREKLRLANLAGQPREHQIEEKKRALIDFAATRYFGGTFPVGLDYRNDPSVLRLDFNEISNRIGLNKRIRKAGPLGEWPESARDTARFSEPRELARLLESMGFRPYSRDGEQVVYGRIREGVPFPVVVQTAPGFRYKPLVFIEMMVQAGITPAEFHAHAGALK